MILLVTKDLFFVPTVQSAARACGVEVVTALSHDSAKVNALAAADVTACVIDLSCTTVEQLGQLFADLRQRFPDAKLVAFGPHVQEQRLNAAANAGCQQVLTRGQLSSQIGRLIPQWV